MASLNKESVIGLTYGQILATITVLAAFVTAWVSLNVRLARVEMQSQTNDTQIKTQIQLNERIFDKIDKVNDKMDDVKNILITGGKR